MPVFRIRPMFSFVSNIYIRKGKTKVITMTSCREIPLATSSGGLKPTPCGMVNLLLLYVEILTVPGLLSSFCCL